MSREAELYLCVLGQMALVPSVGPSPSGRAGRCVCSQELIMELPGGMSQSGQLPRAGSASSSSAGHQAEESHIEHTNLIMFSKNKRAPS